MSVIIPGMNMDHERVSIRPRNVCRSLWCSSNNVQLMVFVSVFRRTLGGWSCLNVFYFLTPGPWVIIGQVAEQEHRERHWTSQQDARVERWHTVVCAQLPRQSHTSLGEEFPNHSRQRPWVSLSHSFTDSLCSFYLSSVLHNSLFHSLLESEAVSSKLSYKVEGKYSECLIMIWFLCCMDKAFNYSS